MQDEYRMTVHEVKGNVLSVKIYGRILRCKPKEHVPCAKLTIRETSFSY